MITNNRMILNKAKENYNKFLVPTSKVSSKKAERLNNNWHRYDLDKKTSVNKIGEIVNLSQILNSYLWELKKRGEDYADVYKDICQLAVMSCIEIDRAKKEFVIDNGVELKDLREKYDFLIKEKPMFFYYLPSEFEEQKNKNKYRWYETSMDYLQQIMIDRVRKIRCPKEKTIPLSEIIVDSKDLSLRNANIKQANKINQMCEELKNKICSIYASESKTGSEKYLESENLKSEHIEKLKSLKINADTIKYILLNLNPKIQRRMMSTLFVASKDEFLKVVKSSMTPIESIEKSEDGNLLVYGIKYQRVTRKVESQ